MSKDEKVWVDMMEELSRRPVSDRDSSYKNGHAPSGDGHADHRQALPASMPGHKEPFEADFMSMVLPKKK